MGTKTENLKAEIEHLKRCIEYDKWLENEVMKVGGAYLNIQEGKTYSSQDAWEAIKGELKK